MTTQQTKNANPAIEVAASESACDNVTVVKAIADAKRSAPSGKKLTFDPVSGKFYVVERSSASPDRITITSIVKDGFAKNEGETANNDAVVKAIADAKHSAPSSKELAFDPVSGKFYVVERSSASPDRITITSIVKDGFAMVK
ncbi:MAG: hypothetical protein NZM06_04910 [Chloroherpetonaceae bacterium]|nr:hypothetical protein [Chloroherpetonaceae bacterium]MDW8438593.1 hypothetical protein [Chloroherpetonaceae bacterium]